MTACTGTDKTTLAASTSLDLALVVQRARYVSETINSLLTSLALDCDRGNCRS